MRKSLAVLAAVGLVATMAVAFAGPAAAKGGPKPPKPPPKESKCSTKSQAGVQYAMDGFLTGANGAAKVAFVQNGSGLATLLDQTFNAASAAGLTKPTQDTVSLALKSRCTGKTTASFTYGLQYKDKATGTTTGQPLANQSGGAVLVKGHWLITELTVCDLTNLLGMALPGVPYGMECYQAAGLPVPTS